MKTTHNTLDINTLDDVPLVDSKPLRCLGRRVPGGGGKASCAVGRRRLGARANGPWGQLWRKAWWTASHQTTWEATSKLAILALDLIL